MEKSQCSPKNHEKQLCIVKPYYLLLLVITIVFERAYVGEYRGMWMAHETDVPLRDAFSNGWGNVEEDRCSRLGLEERNRL